MLIAQPVEFDVGAKSTGTDTSPPPVIPAGSQATMAGDSGSDVEVEVDPCDLYLFHEPT